MAEEAQNVNEDDTAGDGYARLRDIYADYAPSYDRRFARYSRRTLEEAERAIAQASPRRLLDVACGTGLLGERLRHRWSDLDLVGVDLSPEMLEQAARRLPRSEASGSTPLTDWREGSAERVPVGDDEFDTVVCTNAFHLVQEPAAALSEFRRALAPGGRLILVDWCRDFVSMRLLLAWLRVVLPQRRHVRSLAELRGELEAAGLRVTDAWRFRGGAMWGLMTVVAEAPE